MTTLNNDHLKQIMLFEEGSDSDIAYKYGMSESYIRMIKFGKAGIAFEALISFNDYERELFTWRIRREKYISKHLRKQGLFLRNLIIEKYKAEFPPPDKKYFIERL